MAAGRARRALLAGDAHHGVAPRDAVSRRRRGAVRQCDAPAAAGASARRLLAPHIADTLSTNYHTHLTLRRNGFDVTGFSFDYDTILRYYDDGASYFDICAGSIRARTRRGGRSAATLDYPYLGQSCRYFDLFVDYVTEYIRHYYPDDRSLAQDPHLRRSGSTTLDRHVIRGITRLRAGADRDRADPPVRALHLHVSVEHEDNTMWNYAMFLPATVRADGARPIGGRGAGGGELRAADLVGDQPADERREPRRPRRARAPRSCAACSRGSGACTTAMAREPHRHWRILPRDLEASISA